MEDACARRAPRVSRGAANEPPQHIAPCAPPQPRARTRTAATSRVRHRPLLPFTSQAHERIAAPHMNSLAHIDSWAHIHLSRAPPHPRPPISTCVDGLDTNGRSLLPSPSPPPQDTAQPTPTARSPSRPWDGGQAAKRRRKMHARTCAAHRSRLAPCAGRVKAASSRRVNAASPPCRCYHRGCCSRSPAVCRHVRPPSPSLAIRERGLAEC